MPSIKYKTLRMNTLIFYKVNPSSKLQPLKVAQQVPRQSTELCAPDRGVSLPFITLHSPVAGQNNQTIEFPLPLSDSYQANRDLPVTVVKVLQTWPSQP